MIPQVPPEHTLAVGFSLRATILYAERRGRFASTVTHELRTPLTTFRMYSEMLAKGMVPEEKRAEYTSVLERESVRLSRLVENVLAYARIEEGHAGVERESLPVDVLLERCLPALREHCHEQHTGRGEKQQRSTRSGDHREDLCHLLLL